MDDEHENSGKKPSFDEDNIDDIRKRLYSRGNAEEHFERRPLPSRETHSDMVPREHEMPAVPETHAESTAPVTADAREESSATLEEMPKKSVRKKLRIVGISIAVLFFVFALVASSFMLFWEKSTISGENISIAAAGSSAVGGGDIYEFQISIANQNAVPIKSSYLIIEYPDGTLAPDGSDKSLNIERESLGVIESGEIVNVSPKARIFGEENQEKEIKAWIEYRVEGSNATFERHAEPIRIRVSTSPVVLTLNTVKTLSSGQEIEIALEVESNSTELLEDLLVKVSYPDGFDFTESSVDTVSGEDTWSINALGPNEKQTITIKGLLTGNENDVRRFNATIGVPRDGGMSQIASQLGVAETEVKIEQGLLGVNVLLNQSSKQEIVVDDRADVTVRIEYPNTLNTVIYDGRITAKLSGSAVKGYDVGSGVGQYDSTSNTIVWDRSNMNVLSEILPGEKVIIDFVLKSSEIDMRTPELVLNVTSEGATFRDESSERNLMGESKRIIKVESRPELSSMTNYAEGPFLNAGPIPPVENKVTTYTYMFVVEAGVNDLADAVMTANLPLGSTWLDLVSDGDVFTFNPTSRTLTWNIGNLDANEEVRANAQISFKPGSNQVGKIPTILETQQFKATDRFTGTVVRDTASALTTNYTGDRNDRDGVARVVEE